MIHNLFMVMREQTRRAGSEPPPVAGAKPSCHCKSSRERREPRCCVAGRPLRNSGGLGFVLRYCSSLLLISLVSCAAPRAKLELSGPSGADAWVEPRHNPANTAFVPGPVHVPDTLLWEVKTGGEVRAELTADHGLIAASSWDRRLYLFDARTGRRILRKELKAPPTSAVFIGDSLALAIDDDRSRFLFYDLRSQREIPGRVIERTSVPPLHLDEGWILLSRSGKVLRVRNSGDTAWSVRVNAPLLAKPALVGDRLYVVTGGKKVVCLSVDSGRVIWEHSSAGGHAASPSGDEQRVYSGSLDSNFYALDARTGEMQWFFHTGGQIFTAPAVDSLRVYFGANDGLFYALDKETGHLQWKLAAGLVLNSSPVVWDSAVIFGTSDRRLLFVDSKTGTLIREFPTRGSIYSPPVIYDGRVYITDTKRRLYCFGRAISTPP